MSFITNPPDVDADFGALLDQFDVGPSQRPRLSGLDPVVKAQLLAGANALASPPVSGVGSASGESASRLAPPAPPPANMLLTGPPRPDLDAPLRGSKGLNFSSLGRVAKAARNSRSRSRSPVSSSGSQRQSPVPSRTPSPISLALSANTSASSRRNSRSTSPAPRVPSPGPQSPHCYAEMLLSAPVQQLDLRQIKSLRAVLNAESPSWTTAFAAPRPCGAGGHDALLTVLFNILKIEWRTEQHDDLLLHEVLRCFLVLSNTKEGRAIMVSRLPAPFVELSNLLFSDKRPGEIDTRKVIVDLLCVLAEMDAPTSAATIGSVAAARKPSGAMDQMMDAYPPSTHTSYTPTGALLAYALIHPPKEPDAMSVVSFVKVAHQPRPLHPWLTEIARTIRTHFWAFCHPGNSIWIWTDLDSKLILKPTVPGGMTHGVEFSAAAYLGAHLTLLNLLADRLGVDLARSLFEYLDNSNWPRMLLVLRRASRHYYPALHLKIAHHVHLAAQVGMSMPADVTQWLVHTDPTGSEELAAGATPTKPPAPRAVSPSSNHGTTPKSKSQSPSRILVPTGSRPSPSAPILQPARSVLPSPKAQNVSSYPPTTPTPPSPRSRHLPMTPHVQANRNVSPTHAQPSPAPMHESPIRAPAASAAATPSCIPVTAPLPSNSPFARRRASPSRPLPVPGAQTSPVLASRPMSYEAPPQSVGSASPRFSTLSSHAHDPFAYQLARSPSPQGKVRVNAGSPKRNPSPSREDRPSYPYGVPGHPLASPTPRARSPARSSTDSNAALRRASPSRPASPRRRASPMHSRPASPVRSIPTTASAVHGIWAREAVAPPRSQSPLRNPSPSHSHRMVGAEPRAPAPSRIPQLTTQPVQESGRWPPPPSGPVSSVGHAIQQWEARVASTELDKYAPPYQPTPTSAPTGAQFSYPGYPAQPQVTQAWPSSSAYAYAAPDSTQVQGQGQSPPRAASPHRSPRRGPFAHVTNLV